MFSIHTLRKIWPSLLLAAMALMILPLARCAQAQGVSDLYAAGVSYNSGASPAVAGSVLAAHRLGKSGTYAFTMIDAVPGTTKPFTVTTNIGFGVAQKLVSIGRVTILMPTAAGVSYTGWNTGWEWLSGGAALIPVKGNWYVMPTARVLKSSVSNGTGYQPIIGVLVGWGK